MVSFKFFQRCPIDLEIADWILEQYSWLCALSLRSLGSASFSIVTPTADFFPKTDLEGHQKAVRFLAIVKKQMKIDDWPCELLPLEKGVDIKVSDTMYLVNPPEVPGGLFYSDEHGKVTISYNEDQLLKPLHLIATLAHECSHYLLKGSGETLPDNEVEEELLTDLASIFHGFGIFHCNSAFNFQGSNEGWAWQRSGYLSDTACAFALALHNLVNDVAPSLVEPHLKTALRKTYRRSIAYIGSSDALIAIKNMMN